ncbi:MAG: hypothetical protein ACK46X_08140 [Candidatus Sericytochromatia bacterium]
MLAVLCLAGAALARTPQHERLMIWIGSQDQTLLGRGVAGFTLAELPWEPLTFDADRAYLRAVVASAQARTRWDRLSYTPRPDWLEADLDAFAALIEALTASDVAWDEDRSPWLGWPAEVLRCPVHDVFEHAVGCLICNDAAQSEAPTQVT